MDNARGAWQCKSLPNGKLGELGDQIWRENIT